MQSQSFNVDNAAFTLTGFFLEHQLHNAREVSGETYFVLALSRQEAAPAVLNEYDDAIGFIKSQVIKYLKAVEQRRNEEADLEDLQLELDTVPGQWAPLQGRTQDFLKGGGENFPMYSGQ